MRCIFGFICVLAVGLMGCSETAGAGGSAGTAGIGGEGGTGGVVDCSVCNNRPECYCPRPLTDYSCIRMVGFPCETWDEAVAGVEEGGCPNWFGKACKDNSRFLYHDYFLDQHLFYDSPGTLIGVLVCATDPPGYGCSYCNDTSFCERYGPVPVGEWWNECEYVELDLCSE